MFLLLLTVISALAEAGWPEELKARVISLDQKGEGKLGVYVKSLGDGAELEYRAGRPWYLSSTTKVPVAVLILKEVEEGRLSLSDEHTLQESDFVDGAGEVRFKKAGTRLSYAYLLEKMLVQSDSTAADVLIRKIGPEALGKFSEEYGFGPITTILQVRYDAYGELHPKAAGLSNTDFIEFKKTRDYPERLRKFAARIGVSRKDLKAPTLEEAFERYYGKGKNSAPLAAYGDFLADLAEGKLLNEEHTRLVLDTMKRMTTGERRIKAGLPKGLAFAQKTGTQIRRVCNMGVVKPGRPGALVVAACVEKFSSYPKAEALLKKLGLALAATGAI